MKASAAIQELRETLEEYARRNLNTEITKIYVSKHKSVYYVIRGARSPGRDNLKIRISNHDTNQEKRAFMRLNKIHDFTIRDPEVTERDMCKILADLFNLLDRC